MIGDILRIKTSIPPLGANILSRPQLTERLEMNLSAGEGFTRPLTLVSAPAGFGKTTLVRSWFAGREERVAWVALDEEDNEPARFWTYIITALQTMSSNLGSGPLEALRSSLSESASDARSLLIPLLNELFALEMPLYLVIDDYHLVNNTRIHEDLVFFIENLPPLHHLVVVTRSDPPWPLSRWRARGEMVEVRLGELTFSEEETGLLLSRFKGIQLSEPQLHALYKKTEGWVTGLQLAAFSLAASRNVEEFIQNFAGSHRHILHFLSEEVFTRQPETVQDFLLQTSILTRFSAPLCDAITRRSDSAEVLASLERDNLFVIPLDDQGYWYRYHPLFADLLVYQLEKKSPGKAARLHEKAGNWFLEAEEPGEAVRHLLAGNNLEQTAVILQDNYEEILQAEGTRLLNRSLDRFPPELLKKYPRLAAHKALFHLYRQGKEEARACLDLAEETAGKAEQGEIAGILAVVKTYYHIYSDNFPEAQENAEKALELLPAKRNFWRINVAIFSGDARLFSGDPKGAYRFYQDAHLNNKKHGSHSYTLSSGFKVGTSLCYLGRLKEAEDITQEMLSIARDERFSRMPRVGLLWTLLGELLREKGDLEEAERCIERGLFISEPQKPSLAWNCLFKIALSFSQGKYSDALQTIRQIESINLEVELPLFISFPAAAWKARIHLKQEEISKAKNILSGMGVTEDMEVQGGKETGYLVLARLLLAESEKNTSGAKTGNREKTRDGSGTQTGAETSGRASTINRGRAILEQIESLAAPVEHNSLLVETLLVKTHLEEAEGHQDAAESCLLKALQLGEECGYFQAFLDEGKALSPVFSRLIEKMDKGKTPAVNSKILDYARTIFRNMEPGASQVSGVENPVESPGASQEASRQSSYQGLAEELSARELEVLDLISGGYSNQDISEKLFLSVGTVKWHTSNIYGKLGVRGRTQAVALARKLKLIS